MTRRAVTWARSAQGIKYRARHVTRPATRSESAMTAALYLPNHETPPPRTPIEPHEFVVRRRLQCSYTWLSRKSCRSTADPVLGP